MAIKKNTPKSSSDKSFSRELIGQMLQLATSGFGLVAALAWNTAIQTTIQSSVDSAVRSYFSKYSGDLVKIISQYTYAILVSILAITITYQLSKILSRLQPK